MDIRQNLKAFSKDCPQYAERFKEFFVKEDWSASDRCSLLSALAKLLLNPSCASILAKHFRGILLDLLHRATAEVDSPVDGLSFATELHETFCLVLAQLGPLHHPTVFRFALNYFKSHPPPFHQLVENPYPDEPAAKKRKWDSNQVLNDSAIARACYEFVRQSPEDFHYLWNWTSFLTYLNSSASSVKWFTSLSLALLCKFTSQQTARFLRNLLTREQIWHFAFRHDRALLQSPSTKNLLASYDVNNSISSQSSVILSSDLVPLVVSVDNVLLPCYQESNGGLGCLVSTPSTRANLHSLVLAVKKGLPVLLQGPIGSGKTSIVEHLAQLTGRKEQPHLLKIQLGDQTDSKILLGTYQCTDVPGEFIWQPGTLLQAVQNGYWILLEDIDYAPMDVLSLLVPLLETRAMTVPGHSNPVKASPEFHLFATQRLLGSSSGFFKAHSSHVDILDKLFTKIAVQPLSPSELKEVILNKWPCLSPAIDRIVEVYLMISAGKHEFSFNNDDAFEDIAEKPAMPSSGRPVSTRDLLKWCHRMSDCFPTSSEITMTAFQEALDCFCYNISKTVNRIPIAKLIGAKLNIVETEAEFYCTKHKPTFQSSKQAITIGRATLRRKKGNNERRRKTRPTYAFTRQSSMLLEQIAVAVRNYEPVLIVGETGTGKTATVQYLTEETGHRLIVVNMNQHSDSADLLGGFKPVDLKFLVRPLKEEYEAIFCQTFSRAQNVDFLRNISTCYNQKNWKDLLSCMKHTQRLACQRFKKARPSPVVGSEEGVLLQNWLAIGEKIGRLEIQVKHSENALAFSFTEGTLVKAIKEGSWILLDEINLASAETLDCLGGLLESIHGSLLLMERGDTKTIKRHPDFRLFACMNPATDVGKKELPPGLRNRFTEFYMEDLDDKSDLSVLVEHYLKGLSLTAAQIDGIVKFYLQLRVESEKNLTDGTGHKPHYSLRTLCRALSYAAGNPCMSVPRSLYEAFCLSFLTQLDRSSHPVVESLITKFILAKQNVKGILHKPLPEPSGGRHLNFEGHFILKGDQQPIISDTYILTSSIRCNLKDLSRVVAAGRHPVLLQGGTSVGKTSLIKWLANSSGNYCVRVNNHEHTDLQEYVGSYAADPTGKLVFKEGVLVDAMKKGYWIILDELNLAPSDVLEALNRVLDDNRELFIPETQETVKAHPRFMLFATQNPPGHYGGRKVLSRAFRNRFIELHFEEIPPKELEIILHQRCALPPSYCKKLVAIMLELQTRRSSSGIFAGKQGLITLRDLFRWAERYRLASKQFAKFYDWDQHLADEGYLLLAGRVRKPEEVQVIATVLNKHFKCQVNAENLFSFKNDNACSPAVQMLVQEIIHLSPLPIGFDHLVWTYNMRRLAVLLGQALRFNEPVLLVGETGCGKTTVCQFFAALSKLPLYSINCHMHSEGADFLGGLRPVRSPNTDSDSELKSGRLFEWADGPLVKAMREGAVFLADEISLADDSVLERLNSVLEPERTLLIAEHISSQSKTDNAEMAIVAKDSFRFVSTMNPGGDYGKKELSPALRNRFTEIWCPSSNSNEDIINIIEHNMAPGLQLCKIKDGNTGIGQAMLDFLIWFRNQSVGRRATLSIRDILSWVNFINTTTNSNRNPALDMATAFVHGACLVFLDAIGTGITSHSNGEQTSAMKKECLGLLTKQIYHLTGQYLNENSFGLLQEEATAVKLLSDSLMFGLEPFFIEKGMSVSEALDGIFTLKAPTTCMNALRVLRAMQLSKPILLEGSPGVGKTSLIIALARASGHKFVRINLSEQTDISDLFGADLPVEGGRGGEFAWRDGPLLRAIKNGEWVVLDELNLASQSVLEGLNACLDHRGEIYVPELGKTFQTPVHKMRRIFACQNPLNQGGARKGLPKSFLNRFTQVYIEPLSTLDLELITQAMYPQIPAPVTISMVAFNQQIHLETVVKRIWGINGGPWEINLRDVFRWCDLLVQNQEGSNYKPGEYVRLIYGDRMRTLSDKNMILNLCRNFFGMDEIHSTCHLLSVTSEWVQVGHSVLPRRTSHFRGYASGTCLLNGAELHVLPRQLQNLESLMKCIEMNWMAILVGSAAVGKSSLVCLLAELCGHPLQVLSMNSDMDTTELLGGFEQADLNRHLAKLSEEISAVLHARVNHLLINENDHKNVRQLMRSWNKYEALHKIVPKSTTKDEAVYFLEKVAMLKDVIKVLKSQQTSIANVKSLMKKLDKLEMVVKQDEAVNCGGRFEWVDSVLVTAVKKGYWLFIDNVNFCSPSVLDRLNGLLEPNGILSISERGICDGKIPTYTPHPDFRLILSMDPKNGEISRAMKNRGVEIFLGAEEMSFSARMLDLKTLLDSVGLEDPIIQNMLTTIHDTISNNLVAEKPSINYLLRTAQLIVQRTQEGENISYALLESCMEVYVRCQNVNAKKQAAKDIINEVLSLVRVQAATSNLESNSPISVPSCLLSVKEFTFLPELARVKQDSASLFSLIQLTLHDLSTEKVDCMSVFRNFMQTDAFPNKNVVFRNIVGAALKLFLLWGSCNEYPLRVNVLNSFSSSCKQLFPINNSNSHVLEYFDLLVKNAAQAADVLSSCKLASSLSTKLSALFRENELVCEETFYDLRWNPQLLKFLIHKKLKPDANASILLDALFSATDRCNLLFEFHLWKASVEDDQQQFLTQLEDKNYPKNLSLLQISLALSKGVKSSYCIPDALVQHLHSFFKSLFLALGSVLAIDDTFSRDCLSEWAIALHWIRTFWFVCSKPIMGKTLALSEDTVLYLHWLWLTMKAFPVIFGETWESDKFRNQSFLWPIYEKLAAYFNRQLEYVNAYASKLFRIFGHPKPYTSQMEAEICIRLNMLWQKLNVTSKQSMCDVSKIRAEIKDILLLENYTPQIDERAVCLEDEAKLLGLIRDSLNPSPEAGIEVLKDSAFDVQLLELIEHLALMQGQLSISFLMSKSADSVETSTKMNIASELAELSSFATPLQLATMERLTQSENRDNSLLLQHQFDYFNSSWQCTPSEPRLGNDSDQRTSSNNKFQGPLILYTPRQSIMAAAIISEVCDSTTLLRSDHLMLSTNLPLGCCFEKTTQLCDLSNVFWNNAKLLNSPNFDTLINDCSLILTGFCSFLSSLCLVVESSAQETICNAVKMLQAINPRDLPQTLAYRSTVELISTFLVESKLFTKEIQKNWDMIKGNVFQMLNAIQCLDSFESRFALKQLVASTWVYLGWMQASLLAPIFDADPAIRRQLKLQFWQEEEDAVSDDLFVIDLQMHLITGRRLSSCEPTSLHPMVRDFERRILEVGPKINFLKSDQTYRPTNSQYEELRKEMIQFVQTIGSSNMVFNLLEELKTMASDHVLGKVQGWLTSQQAFLQKLSVTYPLYQDLTLPCFIGILQMMHGMTLQLHATKTVIRCNRMQTQPCNLMETIKLLLAFPSFCEGQSCFDVSRSLQSASVTSTILSLSSISEVEGNSKKHLLRLLKSSLLELLNHAITATYLHKDEIQFLDKLLQSVVVSWQQQEEERRRKEAEDESLYLFKGKEYGEIIDEEQQLNQSIKMTFPTYSEVFSDLIPVQSLEEPMAKSPQDNEDEDNTCLNGQITEQEIEDIMSIHSKLFIHYTSCVWHHLEPQNTSPDFVSSFMVRYPVAADILVNFGDMLDHSIETTLLNGHLFVSSLYQKLMDSSSQNDKSSTYDFYRDSNITEAVQCRPILEDFTARINEILLEWPDHPTLLQVQRVIDRILGFAITSPLMKFVTGLELLLGQAQEWEKNAHKGVSLFNQLEAVTKQIINWRKLELRFWSSYLDFVEMRAQSNAAKWWCHIYTTTHNWLNPDCAHQENIQEAVLSSNGIKSIKEICTTLQQFMETSPLGEYKGRLEIMLAFACHLMHTDSSSRQKKIICLYWNLFQYYKQFLPAVMEKIAQLRKPIEKDLKNFIKIARWNDINFWAVKEAVEKSHRMLHKYIKQYENCLKHSSHTVFSDDDLLSKKEPSDGPASFPVKAKLRKQVQPSTATDYFIDSDNEVPSTLLSQLPQLYYKAHRLCKKVLATTLFATRSSTLNDFIGDVISSVHELQALEVNKSSTKDRQRVEAKNINLRKRRGLSDLFRILAEIGLSYRKGQLYCQGESSQELDIALLPPLDVAVAFEADNGVDSNQSKTDADFLKNWQDCPRYFYRSVARMAMLQLSLENPSKELGPANLHRCLGFVAHLRYLCIEQREDLAHLVNALHNIKSLMNGVVPPQLSSTSALLFPPQNELKEWIIVLLDQLAVARQGLGQFLLLLQSCPSATTNPKINAAVLNPTCDTAATANVRQGHPWLINTISATETCIESVRHIQNFLNNEKPVIMSKTPKILTWQNADTVSEALEQFQTALNAVLLPISTADSSPFTKLPYLLLDRVNDLSCGFNAWKIGLLEEQNRNTAKEDIKAPESSFYVRKMHNKANKLVNKILLAIQEAFKKDVTSSTSANENIPEGKQEIDGENAEDVQSRTNLEDGALVNGLHNALKSSLKILDLPGVDKQFLKLLKNWKSVTDSNLPTLDVNQCSKILLRTLPLLKLYTNLSEFYLHSAVNAHHVTTKMNSVLLGLFTELVRKGFCLPAEFSDEVAGDGCTTFEDIEGGGIGEGEGVKDVSDRIENEDQLEEAHQQGNEKQEQEPGKQPDLKDEENGIEMSEDFEGNLHDLDDESQKDDNSSEESDDENELEKQMGDLQGEDADKLDEKVWGDNESDEGDDDSDVEDDKEDEFGPGDGPQEETKLVANSDNKPGEKPDSEEPEEAESPQEENEKNQGKINLMDDREFDDRPDPYFDDKKTDGNEQEDMELPDDLNLDVEEKGEGEQDEKKEAVKVEEDNESDANDIQEIDKDESKTMSDEEGESEEKPVDNENKIDDGAINGEEQDDTKFEEKNSEKDDEGEANKEEMGLEPEKEECFGEKASSSRDKPSQDDTVQPAENNAKDGSSDMVQSAHQGATDDDQAAENNDPSEETSGIGQSEAENAEGHDGKKASTVQQPQNFMNDKLQHLKDRPGQTDEKRSLGSTEQPFHKRLRTEDGSNAKPNESQEEVGREEAKEKSSSDMFQHIEKSDTHHDAQVMDAATREQALEQSVPNKDEDEAEKLEADEDVEMLTDEEEASTNAGEEKHPVQLNPDKRKVDEGKKREKDVVEDTKEKTEQGLVEGDLVETMIVERGLETTMHTQHEILPSCDGPPDVEKLRQELEEQLKLWSMARLNDVNTDACDVRINSIEALEAWHKYEDVTSQLAQDLCEQLRLILEPSLTSKLKGDYRTGKRLNMRKVIPYVASQFRKDKIWLRRTKPSKREYQIMLAIDDSSSMADNHSKQLAFEALAMINKALLLLEAGEVAIASFGETVNLLHQMGEQFSDQVGAAILREFTFQQRKTRIGLVLDHAASMMLESRQNRRGGGPKALEVAQLLIIVSDGRGIFNEGVEAVKKAVRMAIEAGLFIVFVALDNPLNKDSIFDIRVPIFKGPGQLPEIKSYMDDFPFPFYIILRDINSLPAILSDALRQWFELVISTER